MIKDIRVIFLLFIVYSFIGWSLEVICKLITKHKFINRGFLIGPYCPIYGVGCILIITFLSKYKNDFITLFFMSIVICSILEYLTSYFMEKIFGARWWDYSNKKFNLNGRICLETMISFGILGSIMVYILNPFIESYILKIPNDIMTPLFVIILSIFIIDIIISISIITSFKSTIKTIQKDATEEITKKVKEIILKRSIFHRRLINAFPDIQNKKERLQSLENKIKQKINNIKY